MTPEQRWISEKYAHAWAPQAERILSFLEKYGSEPHLQGPADLMGLDCLNGGTAEVLELAQRLFIAPGDRGLDIGCGVGGPARLIANQWKCGVQGVDLCPEQIASANALKRRIGRSDRTHFQTASAEKLPFGKVEFDFAYAIESLVHVDNKRAALGEVYRVLRPGARLLLADYVAFERPARICSLFPLGYHPWSPGEMEALLAETGFVLQGKEDRSKRLADDYEIYAQIFGNGKIHWREVREVFRWWTAGASSLGDRARRSARAVSFLLHRPEARALLFQDNADQIEEFCRAQAQACREGTVVYGAWVAERRSENE